MLVLRREERELGEGAGKLLGPYVSIISNKVSKKEHVRLFVSHWAFLFIIVVLISFPTLYTDSGHHLSVVPLQITMQLRYLAVASSKQPSGLRHRDLPVDPTSPCRRIQPLRGELWTAWPVLYPPKDDAASQFYQAGW